MGLVISSIVMPLQIFTAGKRTDANGITVDFSEATLAKIAAIYDPKLHEAPMVLGHPKHDDPAYGWAAALSVSGRQLEATPTQVDPQFAEWVDAGRYKKISASFYLPGSSHHPIPDSDVPYLRHIGFLGAMPPAVKGMKAIEFAEEEDGVFFAEFTPNPKPTMDEETLKARALELDRREKALLKNEAANFCDGLVAAGHAGVAGIKEKAIAVLTHLPTVEDVQFAEGQTANLNELVKDLIRAIPKTVQFGEFASPGKTPEPKDVNTFELRKMADKRVAESNGTLSYSEAVMQISSELGLKEG